MIFFREDLSGFRALGKGVLRSSRGRRSPWGVRCLPLHDLASVVPSVRQSLVATDLHLLYSRRLCALRRRRGTEEGGGPALWLPCRVFCRSSSCTFPLIALCSKVFLLRKERVGDLFPCSDSPGPPLADLLGGRSDNARSCI